MPKVSVIIPYFKGQAYLEECVQSIEEQKIEDLEIIVVNDSQYILFRDKTTYRIQQ